MSRHLYWPIRQEEKHVALVRRIWNSVVHGLAHFFSEMTHSQWRDHNRFILWKLLWKIFKFWTFKLEISFYVEIWKFSVTKQWHLRAKGILSHGKGLFTFLVARVKKLLYKGIIFVMYELFQNFSVGYKHTTSLLPNIYLITPKYAIEIFYAYILWCCNNFFFFS